MASPASSPKAISGAINEVKSGANSPKGGAKAAPVEDMDMSVVSWLRDTYTVLHWPLTILSVAGLLILGSFVEIAPRKSLEFLDNTLGRSVFFILPFLIALLIDWPTGVLAATVSLIIFARLQKEDTSEGFSDVTDTTDSSTKIISSSHRWFIERILGESPIAISSDRVNTSKPKDSGVRSSSSSMDSHLMPSDSSSSSHK
jgi:hypothetical protein